MALYALDIETDTTVNGLDPAVAAVTSVAVLSSDGDLVVFDDRNERRLLTGLLAWLGHADAGDLVVTWNGSCFDLPFIADRLARWGIDGRRYGFRVVPAADRPPKYAPLPGHAGGYRAKVCGLDHVDIAYLWRSFADERQLPWSLKPVAEAHGLTPVVVDREHVSELSVSERTAYVVSDVEMTLALALRVDDLDAHTDGVLGANRRLRITA